jgi:hypothetical protein
MHRFVLAESHRTYEWAQLPSVLYSFLGKNRSEPRHKEPRQAIQRPIVEHSPGRTRTTPHVRGGDKGGSLKQVYAQCRHSRHILTLLVLAGLVVVPFTLVQAQSTADPWDVSWLPDDRQGERALDQAIDDLLQDTSLRGQGTTIRKNAQRHGVNPAFALAMFAKRPALPRAARWHTATRTRPTLSPPETAGANPKARAARGSMAR